MYTILYTIYRPLTPEQQKDWEKKLTQYAYINNITCEVLLGVDKLVKEKAKGKMLGIIDSLIRAIYAGLEKVYSILKDAFDQVQAGKSPDFTNDVPFPPVPPSMPSFTGKFPSWFMIAWKTVEAGLNLLAERNSKIAEFLPPIEAAGDELVKDLQYYFPPNHQHQLPDLQEFPTLPPSKSDPPKKT